MVWHGPYETAAEAEAVVRARMWAKIDIYAHKARAVDMTVEGLSASSVGNTKAGCPPFETHRFAMLLRVRWFGFTFSESAPDTKPPLTPAEVPIPGVYAGRL